MKNAIIYTIFFMAIQVMASFGVKVAWKLIYGADAPLGAMGMVITMMLFSVITMALFLSLKWAGEDTPMVRASLVCVGCSWRTHPI